MSTNKSEGEYHATPANENGEIVDLASRIFRDVCDLREEIFSLKDKVSSLEERESSKSSPHKEVAPRSEPSKTYFKEFEQAMWLLAAPEPWTEEMGSMYEDLHTELAPAIMAQAEGNATPAQKSSNSPEIEGIKTNSVESHQIKSLGVPLEIAEGLYKALDEIWESEGITSAQQSALAAYDKWKEEQKTNLKGI